MHKTVLQNWQVDVAKMKIIEIGTIEWDTLIYVFQETTTCYIRFYYNFIEKKDKNKNKFCEKENIQHRFTIYRCFPGYFYSFHHYQINNFHFSKLQ